MKVNNRTKEQLAEEIIALRRRVADLEKLESARRKAEEMLRESLREKETLMQEIHHRVKNNLAVVSSLIKLQSRHVDDERYMEMFEESVSRIHTMASVHEKLYRSEDSSKIIFSDYIRDMAKQIYDSHRPGCGIRLTTDIEKMVLSIDAAVPCGLILNELITNSIKYAFPQGREGEIRVALHTAKDNAVEFTVADNGIGIPENIDPAAAGSLGLTLVNALVKQLRGELEVRRGTGTEFRIRFGGGSETAVRCS